MTAHLNHLVADQKHADLTRSAERARLAHSARPGGSTPSRGGGSARRALGRRLRVVGTAMARLAGSPGSPVR